MLCSLNVCFFLQRFQKVVEAYVRYRIDPDDCDQMKMKEILLEVYSFHDAIASGQTERVVIWLVTIVASHQMNITHSLWWPYQNLLCMSMNIKPAWDRTNSCALFYCHYWPTTRLPGLHSVIRLLNWQQDRFSTLLFPSYLLITFSVAIYTGSHDNYGFNCTPCLNNCERCHWARLWYSIKDCVLWSRVIGNTAILIVNQKNLAIKTRLVFWPQS